MRFFEDLIEETEAKTKGTSGKKRECTEERGTSPRDEEMRHSLHEEEERDSALETDPFCDVSL